MNSSGEELDVVVVELSGDLDMATTAETLQTLLGQTSANVVQADLAGVEFMDSSGLRALIEASTVLSAEGRSLALVNVPPAVHRVIQVTHTGHLFGLDSTD